MTREEAIELLKRFFYCDSNGCTNALACEECDGAFDMAIEALKTLPISQRSMYQLGYIQGQEDALQTDLVRCGECKYWNEGKCWNMKGLNKTDGVVDADDFCSYGERKE